MPTAETVRPSGKVLAKSQSPLTKSYHRAVCGDVGIVDDQCTSSYRKVFGRLHVNTKGGWRAVCGKLFSTRGVQMLSASPLFLLFFFFSYRLFCPSIASYNILTEPRLLRVNGPMLHHRLRTRRQNPFAYCSQSARRSRSAPPRVITPGALLSPYQCKHCLQDPHSLYTPCRSIKFSSRFSRGKKK